ncbi:MAG: hypothetical protein RIR11_394 [Bacteroidota bacterium]
MPNLFCMAFLRAEKKSSGTYLRLVESYRKDKVVKHRTLYTFGKLEDFSTHQLEALGRKFLELSGSSMENSLSAPLQELDRHNYGFPLVIIGLLRKIGLDIIMNRFERSHKLSYSLFDCLVLMLCNRLQSPTSKRGIYLDQSSYIGLPPVNLQHMYRSLSYFAKYQEWLQEYLFKQRGKLGATKLDLVFYDVTTFYFQSEVEKDGALRQKGYGKDGKIGKTQVVFGLLVDMKGMPVGYRLYSGDTYEGHTFSDAVKLLRKQYKIQRLVVVADSGMMNRNNISLFEEHQIAADFEYIVGDRLKSLKKTAQKYLCNLENYEIITMPTPEGMMAPLRYTSMEYEGKQLVCTYSEQRAKKDAWEREKKIEKGRKMLESPGVIDQKAKHFFLKKKHENSDQFELYTQKIENDAQFDGFLLVATNAMDLNPSQILQKYKDLYHVEHSFRTFKSFLETRPMFHWTDERIKGHLFVCYLSYYLLAHLKNTLNEDSVEVTEYKIKKILSQMEVSKVKNGKDVFFLRSQMDEITQEILLKLKLPIFDNVLSEAKLADLMA